MATPESNNYPDLTPDQDNQVDKLVDQGFNYSEAFQIVGALPVEQTVSPPTVPQSETSHTQQHNPRGRNKDGSIDLRTLTPRQRLTADKLHHPHA